MIQVFDSICTVMILNNELQAILLVKNMQMVEEMQKKFQVEVQKFKQVKSGKYIIRLVSF